MRLSIARALSVVLSHSEISAVPYELDREDDARGSNTLERSLSLVKAVETHCNDLQDDSQVQQLLEHTLSSTLDWHLSNSPEVSGLLSALVLDGFEYQDGRLLSSRRRFCEPGPSSRRRRQTPSRCARCVNGLRGWNSLTAAYAIRNTTPHCQMVLSSTRRTLVSSPCIIKEAGHLVLAPA